MDDETADIIIYNHLYRVSNCLKEALREFVLYEDTLKQTGIDAPEEVSVMKPALEEAEHLITAFTEAWRDQIYEESEE